MTSKSRSALLFCLFAAIDLAADEPPPRLVVQITVDQLRGDMLPRYYERFGAGGFRRLLDHGLVFSNAHFGTANTFTASGHAVLVTGADTAEHGMVANEWFDRDSGRLMYCTADPAHPLLGGPSKSGGGMSPANLTSTTIGDELVAATAGRSRVFSVAGKDRSAIIPGGHLGKAFWFSEATGGFVSSTYYFAALPAWVAAWNDRKPFARYRNLDWKTLRDPASYRFAPASGNPHARPNRALGRTFPHPLPAGSDLLFFPAFRFTPFLDDLTADFARELLAREKLGQGGSTDYLAISFSATDYIGHAYGPNSVEYEDNLLRLDATLAGLFAAIDQAVGLDHTLVVLSADHGVDDIPEARRALGFTAARIHPDKLLKQANEAMRRRFGTTDDLVAAFVPPGFYLDGERLAVLKLDPEEVASALAGELRSAPGVAYAFSRADLLGGRIARTPLLDRVERSFHPLRSGDVVIVQFQFWYLYHDAEVFAAMHGSPYSYDTFVPVVFAGPGIPAGTVTRAIEPAGIAPTLALLLHLKPPSGCGAVALIDANPWSPSAPPQAGKLRLSD